MMKYCVVAAVCFAGPATGDIVELRGTSQISQIIMDPFAGSDSVSTSGPNSEFSFSLVLDTSVAPTFSDASGHSDTFGNSIISWSAVVGGNSLSGDSGMFFVTTIGGAAHPSDRLGFTAYGSDFDTFVGPLSSALAPDFSILGFSWSSGISILQGLDLLSALEAAVAGEFGVSFAVLTETPDGIGGEQSVTAHGLDAEFVPAPSGLALLCVAGGFGFRRRR